MDFESAKKKIGSYLADHDYNYNPLIIDAKTIGDLDNIETLYSGLPSISLYGLCKGDNLLSLADFYDVLSKLVDSPVVVKGLGTYLKFFGKEKLSETYHTLLSSRYKSKILIVSYQCSNLFHEKDPRYRDNFVSIDGTPSHACEFELVQNSHDMAIERSEKGIESVILLSEKGTGQRHIIFTKHTKEDYPLNLLKMEDCRSAYDLLRIYDPKIGQLPAGYGSDEQWSDLFQKFHGSLENVFSEYFGNERDATELLRKWYSYNDFDKWLLFINLKLRNTDEPMSWCIRYAISKALSFKDLINQIYHSIWSLNVHDSDFWIKYKERKELLKAINDEDGTYRFCSIVFSKNENAIYYLTDNTRIEKQKIIECIDTFSSKYKPQELRDILSNVYPDLYKYLGDYDLGDNFLNDYFRQYKYLKLINVLTPEFKKIVDAEAVTRSYNARLPYRSEELEKVDYDSAEVYFVDALGVEYLSYIEKKCREKGLSIRTRVCKCNLPSITEYNTEDFRTYYVSKGIKVRDEKKLDDLIHKGTSNADYEKVDYPIYLIDELSIINDLIDNIAHRIKGGKIKKGVVVSDHGATRLAVLNVNEERQDVNSVGEHGGRCCRVTPEMVRIPNAIQEGDWYVLADYNSFKGGRKGKIEMHGGSTIEEVTVPIIEIFAPSQTIEVEIETPIVVSFYQKAELHFYTSAKLEHVSVLVEGKKYSATSENGQQFVAFMRDIKKAKVYQFDLYASGELVKSGLEFEIQTRAAKKNDLF